MQINRGKNRVEEHTHRTDKSTQKYSICELKRDPYIPYILCIEDYDVCLKYKCVDLSVYV